MESQIEQFRAARLRRILDQIDILESQRTALRRKGSRKTVVSRLYHLGRQIRALELERDVLQSLKEVSE
jgi:hypothetical protein